MKLKRDLRIFGLILLVSLILSINPLFADSPITDSAFYPATQVETASYVIFRDGSTYYAKNGDSGAIDYSGTNATLVINNALSGGNVWVHLVANTEFVIDTWLIVENNTKLTGSGWSTVIKIADGTNKGAIRNTHWTGGGVENGITIRDLEIDGNKANNPSVANDGGISLRGVHSVLIENVHVKDFNGFAGIYVTAVLRSQESIKTRIINNYVEGCNGTGSYGCGLFITSLPYDSIVSGNVLHNNRYGIYLEDFVSRVHITGNFITNSSMEGIAIGRASGLQIIGNSISYTNGYRHIIIATNSSNNIVSLNMLNWSEYSGILLQTGTDNNTITGNYVLNHGQTAQYGIEVYSNGNIVSNNWASSDASAYGIYVDGDYTVLTSNHGEGTTMGVYNGGSNNEVDHNINITLT